MQKIFLPLKNISLQWTRTERESFPQQGLKPFKFGAL